VLLLGRNLYRYNKGAKIRIEAAENSSPAAFGRRRKANDDDKIERTCNYWHKNNCAKRRTAGGKQLKDRMT